MTEWAETLTIQVVMLSVTRRSLQDGEPERGISEIVCQSYLIVILAVLPLYYIPWNGYYKLGDTKYYLYRNVSLLCQGIALLAMCVFAVSSRWTGEHRIFGQISG